jgi:hypothetical protein
MCNQLCFVVVVAGVVECVFFAFSPFFFKFLLLFVSLKLKEISLNTNKNKNKNTHKGYFGLSPFSAKQKHVQSTKYNQNTCNIFINLSEYRPTDSARELIKGFPFFSPHPTANIKASRLADWNL